MFDIKIDTTQLEKLVYNAVIHALKHLPQINQIQPLGISEIRFFTRKDVAQRLNISLTTLATYQKQGLISFNRIGRKVLFTEININEALVHINTSGKRKKQSNKGSP